MKARKVKGLDPGAPLAGNAEAIVRTRLAELCDFMPAAADPGAIEALHDMRIAAKRLRYVLELTHSCFGPYARTAERRVKALQDRLGEIHDCDVQLPVVAALLEEVVAADAAAAASAAGAAEDLPAAAVGAAPHAAEWPGLVALLVHLRARREVLFARFLEDWREWERKGVRARLEYAASERPAKRARPQPSPAPPAMMPDP
jgi:CHAD domain